MYNDVTLSIVVFGILFAIAVLGYVISSREAEVLDKRNRGNTRPLGAPTNGNVAVSDNLREPDIIDRRR